MPNAADLGPSRRLQAAGVPAFVSRAPADVDDTLDADWTSIDEDDGDERTITEECLWVRRGSDLPAEGDDVLLLLNSVGDPWALCW